MLNHFNAQVCGKSNLEDQGCRISGDPAVEAVVDSCLLAARTPEGLGAWHTVGSCAEEDETWTTLAAIHSLFEP